MKNQIRLETVSFCKQRKLKSRKERHNLTIRLIEAKQRLINGDSSALKEMKNLGNDLKVIDLKDLEGVKIRSRSQWIEDGEKPSRLFFSLEKKRVNDNFIPSLFNKNDQTVSSKDDLCSTATEFYKDLFSASPIDNDIQEVLIDNLDATLSKDNADIYKIKDLGRGF